MPANGGAGAPAPKSPDPQGSVPLARHKYGIEKRQRELKKEQKKEEKRQRKLDRRNEGDPVEEPANEDGSEAGGSPLPPSS
jgi:hypothetical protein